MTFQTMTSTWTMNETRTSLSDLSQGHETRTHELHEHHFELDTETSRPMGSGLISIRIFTPISLFFLFDFSRPRYLNNRNSKD